MGLIRYYGQRTFASLGIRNYRLYFFGQGLSQIGTWMQIVALGWYVFVLTGSGTQLGILLAFRFFPQLVGGPFGGIAADYFSKRKVLLVTQSLLALIAFLIAILVFTETMQVWMVYLLAFLIGAVNTVDNPTRQTFVHEMVGPDKLRNAVALNSTAANLARGVGPLIAGSLIAGIGVAACFFVNAFSFLAVIWMLLMIRSAELYADTMPRRDARFFMDGLRYAFRTPLVLNTLIVMAVIGTFAYEFQVSLPILSEAVFTGGAAGYAALLSAMGFGSVLGGLFSASREKVAPHEFALFALLFGVSMTLTAFMPNLTLAVGGMFFVGFFSINLTSVGNTMVQLTSAPEVRARVISLWTMAIFGSTFVGAPLVGFIAEYAGGRWGLAAGGISALVMAVYAAAKMLRRDQWLFIPAFVKIRAEEEKEIEAPKI